MDDLISRQAAIDALRKREKELRNINWYNNPYAEGECEGISYAMDVIRNTPSAQPEIIRCKDCKYWVPGYITDNDDFIPPKCGEWRQMVGHSSDDYCSLAERREVQDENDKTTNNTTNA